MYCEQFAEHLWCCFHRRRWLLSADKQHYNAVTVIPWPIIVGCDRELIHIENGYGTVSM